MLVCCANHSHYSSKSNPPLLLATNTQLSMSKNNTNTNINNGNSDSYKSNQNQKQKPSAGSDQQKSSAWKSSRLSNEDLNRYLAFQKKKSHYTNTSKLIANLNRINQQQKRQEQTPSAAFKSNSLISEGVSRQAQASSLKPDAAQTFMSQVSSQRNFVVIELTCG